MKPRVTSTAKNKRYFKRNPWVRYVLWARRRCGADEGSKWWPFYGAKGVKCTLTMEQAKVIWERDGAARMTKPSLDRVDPARGYTPGNCRFQEWLTNVRAPHIDAPVAELADYGSGFS